MKNTYRAKSTIVGVCLTVCMSAVLPSWGQEITFLSRKQQDYFQNPQDCIEMLSKVDRIGMYVGHLTPGGGNNPITDEELKNVVDVANALGKGFYIEMGGLSTWYKDSPETLAVDSFTSESNKVARLVDLGANVEYIFYDNPLIRILMTEGLNGGTMDGDWTLDAAVHELAKVTKMWKDYIPGVKIGPIGSPVWRGWKGEGPFGKPHGLQDGYYDLYEMLGKIRDIFPLYDTEIDTYEIDFPYKYVDEEGDKLATAQHHANDQAYWVNRLRDIENEVKNGFPFADMEFVFIYNDNAPSRQDFDQSVHAWIDLYCNQYGGNPDIYTIQSWYDIFDEPDDLMPETTPYTFSWIVKGVIEQYQNGGAETLFSDDFESGNLTAGGWTLADNPLVRNVAPYTGTNCVLLNADDVLTKAFSTEGKTGLTLSYARRCSAGNEALDDGEYLMVEWSPDGVTWHLLEQTQDGAYAVVEFPLPVEAENQAGFQFRFYENADTEWARIDDVSLEGAPAGSNTPPVFIRDSLVEADAATTDAYSGTLANKAVDPDADPVTFSLVSPTNTWLAVAEDGTLSGTPGSGDYGPNSWTVQVSDGTFSNTATLDINVGWGSERVTLFSDGFESGDFTAGGWTLEKTPMIQAGAYSGSHCAQIEWGDVLTKSLDLEGMTEVSLSYAINCKTDMPTNTFIALEVSADGGANWIELERTRNNGYATREWILAPELLTSGFAFRFDKIGAASGDWGRIDDVLVTAANSGYGVFSNLYTLAHGPLGHDDTDGLNNLAEYALGGNPTSNDAASIVPIFQALGDHFYYIHNERTDDPNLRYTVQLSTNLVSNDWNTNGVEWVGEAAFSNVWKSVTNRTDVGKREFIRLHIEME